MAVRVVANLIAAFMMVFLLSNVGGYLIAAGIVLLIRGYKHQIIQPYKGLIIVLLAGGTLISFGTFFWQKNHRPKPKVVSSVPATAAAFNGVYLRDDGKVRLSINNNQLEFIFSRKRRIIAKNTISNVSSTNQVVVATLEAVGRYNTGKSYEHKFDLQLHQDTLRLSSLADKNVKFIYILRYR